MENYSAIHRFTKSLTDSNIHREHLRLLDSTSAIRRLATSLAGGSTYADQINNFDETNPIRRLATCLTERSAYTEYLKRADSTSSLQKVVNAIAASSAFYASVERLGQPGYLDSLVAEVEKEPTGEPPCLETESAAQEPKAIDIVQALASADDPSRFATIIGKCPGWLKWLLVGLFTQILLLAWQLAVGSASGVLGNLITPRVQAYLGEAQESSQREQVKGLKKLSFPELGLELRSYRFITATTLHLRATPNARAPIVGELKFGQVVCVLSSNLDWAEVLYEYGDGTAVTGWVFARYTAKFRG